MHVVIMGCGRTGSLLAAMLSSNGHDVTIVDQSAAAFSRLPDDWVGTTVVGNAVDYDVLCEAGIEHADAFVAATSGDNRNIMAGEIARSVFHVPKVVSRVKDPIRAEIYSQLGIEVDCRTSHAAADILEHIGV